MEPIDILEFVECSLNGYWEKATVTLQKDLLGTEDSTRYEWGLVVAPGLESLAMRELLDCAKSLTLSLLEPKQQAGLIAFSSETLAPLWLNEHLRLPTRLLLRVARFRCRDFPKLFKKVNQIPWGQWLNTGQSLRIEVTSRQSRLNMKKRLQETVESGIKKSLQQNVASAASPVIGGKSIPKIEKARRIYVRVDQDVVLLSMDTSGLALYKRGFRRGTNKAPVRETLAAACLAYMSNFQGKDAPAVLLDPMMGSGVFLLEAMLSGYQGSLKRNYAFQQWRFPIPSKPVLASARTKFSKLIGIEWDEDSYAAAAVNLEKQHRWLARFTAAENLPARQLVQQSFLDVVMQPEETRLAWVVLNPPYDRRLEFKGFASLEDLLEKLKVQFHPELIGILWPAEKTKGRIRVSYDLVGRLRFKNGGIPIDFLVFRRPQSLI